jgi:hypothetical protein
MTPHKKIELFDKYFSSAMIGVLSNPDIVKIVCATNLVNGTKDDTQKNLTNVAASYAILMLETREHVIKNVI